MKISIITICYNNAAEIIETVKTVISQTYPSIEYIIVDGGSTDNTLELLEPFAGKIAKVISEPDKGIYDAINKGIRNASGDIIGLIHAGDKLYNHTVIEKVAAAFHKDGSLDALYGHSIIVDEKDENKVIRINDSPEFKKSLFKNGWFPSHQSFYAKRSLFDQLGYYNLKYKIAADYELLLRFLYVNTVKVKLIDQHMIKFKHGGTSTRSLGNIMKLNVECMQAWKDNNLSLPPFMIPLKLLRKIPQYLKAKN